MKDDSVWLNQSQIAELFQTDRTSITKHLGNIYSSGELDETSTCAKIAQVQREGKRSVKREIVYYNLDVIISVGYRVQSHIATQFRNWATRRLKEYIIKGFVLDDERLKMARNSYFDELLARIRDIRSSEKVFYRKGCEIYATSADYDPSHVKTREFFATVQNKFHWAVTGKTAAQILLDAGKVSAQLAKVHVDREFMRYKKVLDDQTPDEFDKVVKGLSDGLGA